MANRNCSQGYRGSIKLPKRLEKMKKANNGEDRNKFKVICGETAKRERVYQRNAQATWEAQFNAGQAEPRLKDGSWWSHPRS